jgi:uncharacterized protein
VQSEVEQLLILQDRDQKIKRIRTELRTVPQQRASLEAQLNASASALDAAKQRAQQIERDKKKLELDIGTRTETINRLRTQQYETRKNEEFRAMGNEIERYQKEISAIEDQELELMEQADKVKIEVADAEKHVTAARASVAGQMKDLEDKTATLEARLKEISAEREQIASTIDEDVLDRFNRLFASKGDAAVVALEHEVCTGCHMKVPAQLAHRARAGKELVNCTQCGRILYWAD